MFVSVCVCKVSALANASTSYLHRHAHARTHARTHTHTTHKHTHIHNTQTHKHTHIHTSTRIDRYIHGHAWICTIYIHMHAYTCSVFELTPTCTHDATANAARHVGQVTPLVSCCLAADEMWKYAVYFADATSHSSCVFVS